MLIVCVGACVCVSSDVGTVLKVVMIPRESWHDLEEVVLEEMTVFRVRKRERKKKTHKAQLRTYKNKAMHSEPRPDSSCTLFAFA